ncbi:MAG: hypothetical protein ABIR88_02700 [Nitrospiria bacterium]
MKRQQLGVWTGLVMLTALLLAPCFHAAAAEAHPHGGLPTHEAADPCLLGATLQGPPSGAGTVAVPVQLFSGVRHGDEAAGFGAVVPIFNPPSISPDPLYLLHRQYRL